jgi:hypothetical protein
MKSMMLITSSWGVRKTFKMLPVTKDCPFNEVIFDPEDKVLAVISKEKKETFHMMTKLNEWGDPLHMKIGKRENGKDYAEERKALETFYEYFISEEAEIKQFIEMFGINADTFDLAVFNEAFHPTDATPKASIVTA